MRKFRVWDHSDKKMLHSNLIMFSSGRVSTFTLDPDMEWGEVIVERRSIAKEYVSWSMGLQDEDGADIYEGDFLTLKNGAIELVEWVNCRSRYELKNICGMGGYQYFSEVMITRSKILGNKFEMPQYEEEMREEFRDMLEKVCTPPQKEK